MKYLFLVLFAFGVCAAETNIVVETILVRMNCSCGGEMKPTGTCLTSYPPQYEHRCDKCGTNRTYNVSYPEIRYVTK